MLLHPQCGAEDRSVISDGIGVQNIQISPARLYLLNSLRLCEWRHIASQDFVIFISGNGFNQNIFFKRMHLKCHLHNCDHFLQAAMCLKNSAGNWFSLRNAQHIFCYGVLWDFIIKYIRAAVDMSSATFRHVSPETRVNRCLSDVAAGWITYGWSQSYPR